MLIALATQTDPRSAMNDVTASLLRMREPATAAAADLF